MKKWFIRKILTLAGYDYTVTLHNVYQNRRDTLSIIDFLLANHKQQQAIPVTLPDGTKQYGQPGHYDTTEFC